jgi:cytochrome c biogenesis protein CcmG/thiol:disulfide interchange protein DsbE
MADVETPEATQPKRFLAFLPLVIVLALALLFFMRLGAGDSSKLPSTLIGHAAPPLSLQGFNDQPKLNDADLRQGHVTVINMFASWCEPCRSEHPVLMTLAQDQELIKQGVRIIGIASKDNPKNVKQFLDTLGNPYGRIAFDPDNRAGIEWGVYGIPETFIVRGDGIISYKFVGPMDDKALTNLLRPEIQKALLTSSKSR